MRRLAALVLLAAASLAAAGCGSGGSSGGLTVGTPKTFSVASFQPSGPVEPGKPFRLSFVIKEPSGDNLTAYKRGAGPHTGVHLIFVRRDLSSIVHLHPRIAADGTIATDVTLPQPGPYLLLIDVYANLQGQPPNFQLKQDMTAKGAYKAQPLPPFSPRVVVDGYTFQMDGEPKLQALQPAAFVVHVTDPQGKPARFEPWYGALAHAIFFKSGSLDYFHTHICGRGAANCAGIGGAPTGRSTKPGELRAGVVLPVAGTWRLFLQTKIDGKVLSAPFTLAVS